ncbi:MAG: type II secretion system F family protein [Lactobacillales bacterium]|jgi:tight adherence protein C|nr:type II secretion system F family protein [Lactobacillales bacterium]
MQLNILGNILVVVFILLLIVSRSKSYLVENITNYEFPLKDLYTVGFYILGLPFVTLDLSRLKEATRIKYNETYADYYANLIMAQAITLTSLAAIVTILLSSFVSTGMRMPFIVFGIVMSAVLYFYLTKRMRREIEELKREYLRELPEVISKLAILTSSGMILSEAIKITATSEDAPLYNLFKESVGLIENGASDTEALDYVARKSELHEIRKFTRSLAQTMDRGSAELVEFLTRQSGEIWMEHKQHLLQEGERAAGKLLAPVALSFGAVIGVIVIASMSSMHF